VYTYRRQKILEADTPFVHTHDNDLELAEDNHQLFSSLGLNFGSNVEPMSDEDMVLHGPTLNSARNSSSMTAHNTQTNKGTGSSPSSSSKSNSSSSSFPREETQKKHTQLSQADSIMHNWQEVQAKLNYQKHLQEVSHSRSNSSESPTALNIPILASTSGTQSSSSSSSSSSSTANTQLSNLLAENTSSNSGSPMYGVIRKNGQKRSIDETDMDDINNRLANTHTTSRDNSNGSNYGWNNSNGSTVPMPSSPSSSSANANSNSSNVFSARGNMPTSPNGEPIKSILVDPRNSKWAPHHHNHHNINAHVHLSETNRSYDAPSGASAGAEERPIPSNQRTDDPPAASSSPSGGGGGGYVVSGDAAGNARTDCSFREKRASHYNEYYVLKAMREKMAQEDDDEDEDK
jgi:hypothetical protein